MMGNMDTMPSHDDANLILRLYELRRDETMRKARKWFVENYFATNLEEAGALCPPGSQENAWMRQVTSYWEMAASFVASGVLNQELFFQSNQEMLLVWIRVRGILPGMRTAMKSPGIWKNLETVGNACIEYLNRTAPGTFEVFVERMGRPAPKPQS
jgi:hypothetical protein